MIVVILFQIFSLNRHFSFIGMLLRILSRLNETEQRWQCLHTLRHKLNHYQLNWNEIKEIIDLFHRDHHQPDLLLFLLNHIDRSRLTKIEINDYFQLTEQFNETIQSNLFKLIVDKFIIRNEKDFQEILQYFRNKTIRNEIEELLRRFHRQFQGETIQIDTNQCQMFICPKMSSNENESIRILTRQFSNSSISSSSSSSNLSTDEFVPIRTRSLMGAIKNTFERLKDSSS